MLIFTAILAIGLVSKGLIIHFQMLQVTVSQGAPDSTKHHHRQVRNNLSPRGVNTENTPVTMTMTERQQLAELVQQNMERHRRRQHHLR